MSMTNKASPKALADRLDHAAKELGIRLFQKRKALLSAIGERPMGGLPVSENDRYIQYNELLQDPEGMAELVAKNVRAKEDGRVLVRKDFVKTINEMESQRRGGVI